MEVHNLPLGFSRVDKLNEETDIVFKRLILVTVLVPKYHVSRKSFGAATYLFNELGLLQLLLRSNEQLYIFRLFIFDRYKICVRRKCVLVVNYLHLLCSNLS